MGGRELHAGLIVERGNGVVGGRGFVFNEKWGDVEVTSDSTHDVRSESSLWPAFFVREPQRSFRSSEFGSTGFELPLFVSGADDQVLAFPGESNTPVGSCWNCECQGFAADLPHDDTLRLGVIVLRNDCRRPTVGGPDWGPREFEMRRRPWVSLEGFVEAALAVETELRAALLLRREMRDVPNVSRMGSIR